jgi:hypothetical protein
MSIAIFHEITTEEYLLEIEAEGKKCTGLYADMSDAPQRKFIKDQAANIKGMIKRLDRARIDRKAAYGTSVDKAAASIKQRLENANSTYTLLIDDYAADCKKVRDDAKAIEDARSLAIEIESDHEHALLLDNQVMYEKHLAEENRIKYEAKLKEDAVAEAVEEIKADLERQKQLHIDNEKARLDNREHVAEVNNKILAVLMLHIDDREIAKEVVREMAKGEIPYVTIQY